MDYLDLLREGGKQLNIDLNESQIRQFDTYLKQLRFFNKKFNLTAITEPAEIVTKHFLDSLSVINNGYIKQGRSLVDIGAGAGFPGLPIKIVLPTISLTLLESNRKKSMFLDYLIDRLRLKNVSVVNLRAEEFGSSSGRGKFDVAITRAISSTTVNLEYALPTLKVGGYYLAMKATIGKEPPFEHACKELGCSLVTIEKVEVPFLEAERNILIFRKVRQTNQKYPRRAGVPAKSPL